MKKAFTPSPQPDASDTIPLVALASILVSSGFLPPRELFRFAHSSKAVAESLADIDVWKQLCIARLGRDAVDKIQNTGFAPSCGEDGRTWEHLFRALCTHGQMKGLLGKERPPEQWRTEYERIPKSYMSQQEPLDIPELCCQTEDYCIIFQIMADNDVSGETLFTLVLPGEEMSEQQETAFFVEGNELVIEIPADRYVPKVKVPLQHIPSGCKHFHMNMLVVHVHLLRKTDGKVCCILESVLGNTRPWTPSHDRLPVAYSSFRGLPLALQNEGRDFIGCFDPVVTNNFWHLFRSGEKGLLFRFHAYMGCHYERSDETEENRYALTALNLLDIRLMPQLIMGIGPSGTLVQKFLPREYTSEAISIAHFFEQLTGWV